MASVDLNFDYNKIQSKLNATKTYANVKSKYNDANKIVGDSFEKSKKDVSQSLDKFKDQTKRYQKQIKNQFEQLLDLANTTGGNGSGSPSYIKSLLIRTINNVQPRLRTIVMQDCLTALGCDQQQTYGANQEVYVKVGSVDLFSRLKIDPNDEVGKIIYEKDPVTSTSTYPFSMNHQMYNLTQNGQTFAYNGKSNQKLFDIQYMENQPAALGGATGPWYQVKLADRLNSVNRVGEFMIDYYDTIKMAENTDIMASIMESLCGAVSMKVDAGTSQVQNASQAELIMARILGLCFDGGGAGGNNEIDVSGVAKVPELDGVDDSFFEFTDIDLRNIDLRVGNIKNGVVQFEDCDNVLLPVNYEDIISALGQLNFVEGSEFETAANNISDVLANNPAWQGIGLNIDAKVAVDTNFIKLISNGVISSLITPKMILPIIAMSKALGNNVTDDIKSFTDFAKIFKSFFINLASKVGAIFVEEIYKLVKSDILRLLQSVITDIVKEKQIKKYAMILKLISLLLFLAGILNDFRRCKSLVDDIFKILNLINLPGFGGSPVPLPIMLAAQFCDGYSETRAFIGAVEEMQKAGIPTGDMPSGAPNLELISKLGQMKAMAFEEAENNKVQIAVGPLTITPAGFTVPANAFGKKF
jgi:hypothetical protein